MNFFNSQLLHTTSCDSAHSSSTCHANWFSHLSTPFEIFITRMRICLAHKNPQACYYLFQFPDTTTPENEWDAFGWCFAIWKSSFLLLRANRAKSIQQNFLTSFCAVNKPESGCLLCGIQRRAIGFSLKLRRLKGLLLKRPFPSDFSGKWFPESSLHG